MICWDGLEYTIDFSRKIGTGAYGNVYPGRTQSGRRVAVKHARDDKEIRVARKEVEFYRRCAGAPNIVKYIGSRHKPATEHSPERFSFAMERALSSIDSLIKQVRNLRGLSKEVIIDLLCDSVSALTTLKERGIAHRDIKHLNILVFPGSTKGRRSQYLFKFCDMGVSSFVHEDGVMQTLVGTPNALCPELAAAYAQRRSRTDENYTREQCDLWSFGCTLYFVATGAFPFPIDSKDSSVYAHAVAEGIRPEGAISAERVSGDSNRYMYKYGYKIENPVYPKWFCHCLTKMVAMLFSPNRSLEALRVMVDSLKESVEKRFLSIESVDVYSYCDLSSFAAFRGGYPSLKQELDLKPGVEYRLIYENEQIVFTTNCLETNRSRQSPPILFPLLADIPWSPKRWGLSVKELGDTCNDGENPNNSVRTNILAQAGEALRDCEKIVEVVETSRNILRTQLERLKIELESVREKTAMPMRFTIHAKMHSFALMPFVETESDKVVMNRICELADRAAKALETCTDVINQSLTITSEHLSELDAAELHTVEEPGLEDELNAMLSDDPHSPAIFEYERKLANKCVARRAELAAQMCNKSHNSIVRVLLRVARFTVDMKSELMKYGNVIDDCIGDIERPFQELKNCMERLQADNNLDERSFRKALQYYKQASKIMSHTRLIHEKANLLYRLVKDKDQSQNDCSVNM
ncbi:ATP-dependent (S)-NAD(P)H-hydrate dehydratase [Trichostrongylus colubriformis]|uniref:IkappaB kinase n=1 Tax=Trichostrongylus colubriformis TaxID=6319 RepID=A0AAN8IU89_TRICO